MPFVEIATGAKFDYEDVGVGVPVVALHGRFGTARVDLGGVIDWLAKSYRVLGPSLRGYGESTPKPRDYPLDFYHRDARDVLAFMDALKIERAHLIGYSDGGETALVAAGLAPERFISVAVWGAVGYYGPHMRAPVQRNYPADWMDEETKRLHGITDPNAIVLQWVQALKYMIDSGGDVSLSLAPKVTCPALLMLGTEDHLNPQEYAQRWVESAPNARLVMFKTGHACHEQAPEEFMVVVEKFLKSGNK